MCYHMCAWCRYTRGRFESTHGGVLNVHTEAFLNVHTEAFLNVHTGTPHTPHNTTTHNTPTHKHNTETDRETQRQRETERNRERETRQDKKRKRREDKTRKEKTRQYKRRNAKMKEERREKTREDREKRRERTRREKKQDKRRDKMKREKKKEKRREEKRREEKRKRREEKRREGEEKRREEKRREEKRRERREEKRTKRGEMKKRRDEKIWTNSKKCFKTLKPARWISPTCFEKKKSPSDELFLHFSAKVQNLTFFSNIYMIRIRFFLGPGNQFRMGFGRHGEWTFGRLCDTQSVRRTRLPTRSRKSRLLRSGSSWIFVERLGLRCGSWRLRRRFFFNIANLTKMRFSRNPSEAVCAVALLWEVRCSSQRVVPLHGQNELKQHLWTAQCRQEWILLQGRNPLTIVGFLLTFGNELKFFFWLSNQKMVWWLLFSFASDLALKKSILQHEHFHVSAYTRIRSVNNSKRSWNPFTCRDSFIHDQRKV